MAVAERPRGVEQDDVEIAQLRQKARAGVTAVDSQWAGAAASAAQAGGLLTDPEVAKRCKGKGEGEFKQPDSPASSPGPK